METTRRNAPNVKEHKERKFAVVRWSEGEDAGKLSEVKTDNIRRYDDSKMDQHGNPISTYSAIIEWRHGKKQPGGCQTEGVACRRVCHSIYKRVPVVKGGDPSWDRSHDRETGVGLCY
ncbi:uncharacterized protein ACNS7B_005457 isoform 1-T1 [Menidia menidia]